MIVWGVVGWKNSGKTGLVERLVTELTGRGLTVSTVKHAHHAADIDHPGTDSFRHRAAGAREVILVTAERTMQIRELNGAAEPGLDELLSRLGPADMVLVEGFKREGHPKIEAHRAATGRPLIAPDDPTIRAVATDTGIDLDRPVFALDDTRAIADFLLEGAPR